MKATLQLLFTFALLSAMGSVKAADTCEVRKLEATRMADLNIPRAGHQVFYVGGELMVAGGHTDGFVPTPTAEYYADGKWHQLSMTYNHDFGISVMLKSGKVLLAGGCEQPTGIGQTYTAEFYDPLTHTFRGFGNMNVKRVWANNSKLFTIINVHYLGELFTHLHELKDIIKTRHGKNGVDPIVNTLDVNVPAFIMGNLQSLEENTQTG
jgi:hypothetical protein